MNLLERLPESKQRFEAILVAIRRRLRQYGMRQVASAALLCIGLVLMFYVAATYRLMNEWEQQNSAGVTTTSDSALTRLLIPKINLDVVIVEGTSNRALTLGPGHLKNTAMPGDPGNSVIAAHRDTYFRHVYELKPG